MIQPLLSRLQAVPSWRWSIPAVLVLVSLLVRLPFFFPAVIDWDEGTYLLMGQAILNGDRLYVDVWEHKPPFAYLAYAAAIAVSGASLVGIRLVGALLVGVSALFVFGIASFLRDRSAGMWAAIVWILLASLLPGGMAVMTEHVAMLPFTAGLFVLVTREWTGRWLLVAGALMGAAAMVRTNLALVALTVGLIVPLIRRERGAAGALLSYGTGGLIAVLAGILPTTLAGRFDALWRAVVTAGLAFSSAQLPWTEVLRRHVEFLWESTAFVGSPLWGTSVLGWLGAAAGLALISWKSGDELRGLRPETAALLAACVATAVTIAKTGVAHPHYLIQIAPFAAVASGIFWSWFGSRWRFATALVLVLVGSALVPVVRQSLLIMERVRGGEPAAYGTAIEIAKLLRENGLDRGPMLFMTDHVVLWMLDARPLLGSITHPSAMSRDYLLTAIYGTYTSPADEMAKILAREPDVVVTVDPIVYLAGTLAGREAEGLLREELAAHYRLLRVVGDRQVHVRTDRELP